MTLGLYCERARPGSHDDSRTGFPSDLPDGPTHLNEALAGKPDEFAR